MMSCIFSHVDIWEKLMLMFIVHVFLYNQGDYAHSGFPEIAFSRFANALVEKGYKIARIEQTETPDMLAQRSKGTYHCHLT